MRHYLTIPIFLALAACSSEIDNKPAATVTEAPAEQAPPPADNAAKTTKTADDGDDGDGASDEGPEIELKHAKAPAGSEIFDIAQSKSKIEWVGAKVTGDHKGGFTSYVGEILVKDNKILSTSFAVELSSVFSDAEKLTKHLKSADFFDVEKYTIARFSSIAIKPGSEAQGNNVTVVGELDFHGQKKTITFPAMVVNADDAFNVKSEFTINRKDWGVDYPGKADDLIKDEVLIKLDLNFPTE